MKNWIVPEIETVELTSTEHEFRFQCSRDGGYLGDGKISGWFGKNNETVTIVDDAVPATSVVEDAIEFVS